MNRKSWNKALTAVLLAAGIVAAGAMPAHAAPTGCNSSGTFCFYKDANFTSFMYQYTPPTEGNGITGVSSVRNRTSCAAHLIRYTSGGTPYRLIVAAGTEVNLTGVWNDAVRHVHFEHRSGCAIHAHDPDL